MLPAALASLWLNLENHEYRFMPQGERILLTYQAWVRKEWHDSLKMDKGFNIGLLNKTLLKAIAEEVWNLIREDGVRR